ncbi:MAG: DUF3298 domain-containing protein [Desulfovibrio sp.]|nr:DUF3298 domain-containing protein [Desulfovibrio sp.]
MFPMPFPGAVRAALWPAAVLLLAWALAAMPGLAFTATPRLLAAASSQAPAGGRPPAEAPRAEAATPDSLPATPEDAVAQLSGSQWPGVIDHLLQKPLPASPSDPQGAEIHINYPSLGRPAVDADIRSWVTGIANAFEAHLDLSAPALAESESGGAAGAEPDADASPAFELWGSYSISRPSDAAISITFEIWNYIGANPGNLDILTLNYSLLTGQRLAFMDLFEKPEIALRLMSDWSRKELAPRLGATTRLAVLEAGTAPLVENFSSLTLTPEGVCINFQPYQVAPWAAGVQKVEMPLEALLPAGPLLALWGR